MPNIIQIQDDLKNLPDQVLVNYVQNPTGTMQGIAGYAPSYLVLAELQRRTDMRNRYAAQQQPEKTVSDKIVEEATPMQNAQRLMGGVGALPAGNVGENYGEGITAETYPMPEEPPIERMAGGGIVAFQRGGLSLGDLGYDTGINYDPFTDMPVIEEPTNSGVVNVTPNEYYPYPATIGNVPFMPKTPDINDYKEDQKFYEEQFGVTPAEKYYQTEREALQKERDSYQTDRRDAINMGMIEAGLNIMGGTSQYTFENIGKGAAPVVSKVASDLKSIKKEQRLLDKESRAVDRLERAEKMGNVKDFRTQEKEVRAIQLDLLKNYVDNVTKAQVAAATKAGKTGELVDKAYQRGNDIMKLLFNDNAIVTYFNKNPEQLPKVQNKITEKILSDMESGQVTALKLDGIIPREIVDAIKEASGKTSTQSSTTTSPVSVTTREEVLALSPGTVYEMPDGTKNVR